jgi:hypothetical protein
MSNVFFFRLHKLRHRDEERRSRIQQQQQQQNRRGGRRATLRCPPLAGDRNVLTLAPGRLFERPTMDPADSLDCVALQIPRSLHIARLNLFLITLIYATNNAPCLR